MKPPLRTLALAFILAATPAHACHRFSVWKYPTPQRCSVSDGHIWHVEITKTPPLDPPYRMDPSRWSVSPLDTIFLNLPAGTSDEDGRAEAIEALKAVMNGK